MLFTNFITGKLNASILGRVLLLLLTARRLATFLTRKQELPVLVGTWSEVAYNDG